MHMWFWFGYDLGEFLFPRLDINTRLSFALTWIALFFVSVMFEGSKVYLAQLQKEVQMRLHPHRSDERRTLLYERDQLHEPMGPTTSRNASTGEVRHVPSLKDRLLVNVHQSLVFIVHNTVGFLLMLAVMVYNVHLLLAVVFGMMLGHFLFGTKLTRLQMKCYRTKRVVICTPECDDTAEGTTPPLLDSSVESDYFVCQTRSCVQPHYAPTTSSEANVTCHYGAKKCPSKVARARKSLSQPSTASENSPVESQSCCKKKQEVAQAAEKCCGKKTSQAETALTVVSERQAQGCCSKKSEPIEEESRESTPSVSCCHNKKTPSESQEHIT